MTDAARLDGEPAGRVVGLDGCAGGWFAVWNGVDEPLAHERYDTLEAVFADHAAADRMLVDIPIGLTNDGPRDCDTEAREQLGLRGVSVFPAPSRGVVDYRREHTDDASYERATELQREQLDSGISQQAWNITDKIAEMDAYLQEHTPAVDVYESHPECCFAALNDGYPIAHSKSGQTGRAARFAVLADELADWEDCYRSACDDYYYNQVARDDIIDAMVLVAAGRCPLASIPDQPPVNDEIERQTQIVVPAREPVWDEYLDVATL